MNGATSCIDSHSEISVGLALTDEERILNAAKDWVRRCTNAKQENNRVRIGVEAIVTNGRITDIEVIDRRRA